MTSSTPPAWNWLHECYVPVTTVSVTEESSTTDPGYYPADVDEMCHNYTEAELSIGPRNLPDSATMRGQNDSYDPTGEDIWPLDRDQRPDCAGVQSVRETPTKLRVGARNEHPEWVCNDCGQDRYGSPFGVSTWHEDTCDICGETKYVTEPRDFCGYRHDADPMCTVTARKTTSPADSFAVESCPECGTVTDIEYGDADSFRVPFRVQEWMFESLAEVEIDHLHDLIDDHHELIIEMARDRFRTGYATYGSTMYGYSPERRLDEVLCELADATCYLTSGSVE